jgi:capsid protein
MALLRSAIPLPAEKIDKFNMPMFSGRRWPWVDPEKDVNARIKEIQAGASTLGEWLAEKGEDLDEKLQELAREKQKAEGLGLDLLVFNPLADKKASAPNDAPPVDEQDALVTKALELANGNGNGHK